VRLIVSPFRLAAAVLAQRAVIVHLNTALTLRAYWRDSHYAIVARLCGATVLYQVHGGALPQAFCRGHRLLTAFRAGDTAPPGAIVAMSASEADAFRGFVGRPGFRLSQRRRCTPYARLVRSGFVAGRTAAALIYGRLVREKGLYELLRAWRCELPGVAANCSSPAQVRKRLGCSRRP